MTRKLTLCLFLLLLLFLNALNASAEEALDTKNNAKHGPTARVAAVPATSAKLGPTDLDREKASEQNFSARGHGSNTGLSRRNMVATVAPQATEAGLQAMREGGNAVDAAIAAALTLGVVDGYNSGIGGGCFILIRTADGNVYAIDGRETAPASADRNFYRDKKGNLQPLQSQNGPRAVAVPGALLAFEQAATQHGRKELKDLLLPAAEIAESGFPISQLYSSRINNEYEFIAAYPDTAAVLLKENGLPLEAGDVLRQPDLAATYRGIAESGTDYFYRGPFSKSVAKWMSENEGAITEADFDAYRTVDRSPVKTTYRGHTVFGFPPPSSGGIHVAQILNILEQYDLAQIAAHDKVDAIHLVAESMKFAFADRAYWPGDPSFVEVPRGLISKQYAEDLAEQIDPESVVSVDSNGEPPNQDDVFVDRHTTHIAAADDEGNWVAITSTINTTFGSKVIVPGTGVILNNEMDDFSIAPGVPNAFNLIGADNNSIAAGKRPLSSMSPTIVLRDGEPILTVGAAGGPKIISQVVWALINTIDFGMSPEQAIGQPRVHHQWSPDYLRVENTLDMKVQRQLKSLGHELFFAESTEVGVSQIIARDPKTGVFTGTHDPRVPGRAAGLEPLENSLQAAAAE